LIEFFLFAFTNLLVFLLLVQAARGEKKSGQDSLGLFAYKEDPSNLPPNKSPADA
jgi:hypothetical protein